MKGLVVGTGMYVAGHPIMGGGTILKTLIEQVKIGAVKSLTFASKTNSSEKKIRDIFTSHGLSLPLNFLSSENAEDLMGKIKNENFDFAMLSLPDDLHYPYAKELLKAKINLLVVKPLVKKYAQNLELVKLQREAKVLGCVEFHKRFDESNLYAKKIIQENVLGRLDTVLVDYSQKILIPLDVFKGWAGQTTIFDYLGIHYVDLIYFLTGFKPARVSAWGKKLVLKEKGTDTYDSIHSMIEWQSKEKNEKFISHLHIGWINPVTASATSLQKIDLVGEHGRLNLDQTNRGIVLNTKEHGLITPNPYFSEYLPSEGGTTYQGYGPKSISQFLSDVVRFKKGEFDLDWYDINRPSFKQHLVSVSALEAVNKSLASNNNWIENEFI